MDNKYKETVSQVVEMLRSYYNEPDDDGDTDKEIASCVKAQMKMASTIFSEMLQYVPEDEKEDLKKQFNRSR